MKPKIPTIVLLALLGALGACNKEQAPNADTLNAHGLASTEKGEYDKALEEYDQAIRLKPDFASAYKNRGVTFAQKGDYDSAIRDFDQALKLKPDMASAFNSRGLAHQSKGDFVKSVQDFDEAIKLRPDNATALKNRGRSQFFQGKFAEAAADLEKGGSYDSTNAYVVIWWHLAKQRLGQDDAKGFVAKLARTDTVTWPAPVARYYLGKMTAEELDASAVTTKSKVQSDQRCAASFYIGEFLLLKKQIPAAKKRFENARDKCPKAWTEQQGAVAELGRLGGPAAK
ncbi:MAG: repeat precursor [Gemmatimonadetes bacterium]|jgi:lipoprotein NlpI|nr:repeat precursor [Gemmatimonadota bacterium]